MFPLKDFMLPIFALWISGSAAAPVGLIRKHPHLSHLSITPQGGLQKWGIHDRAPTGHKYEHLQGFQAAFEEMNAIRKAADPENDAVKEQLAEECSAAGEACKKSVGLVKDQRPEDREAKMEYLCTKEALSCLSANMEKCRAVHEEVTEIQKLWQCEAIRCSAAGPNCSTAVTFLQMDDSKLTDETRHKKSRFLCSAEARQCLGDHKDLCKTANDIVSTAVELGHCDRMLCSEKGHDCRTAVTFLTQEPMSNVTVTDSKEKWAYLCGDAAFHCLESHLEQCTRYYNTLKLAFAEGHCNSARCASEGPDCARAVKYLSDPDKFYYGEELRNKTQFLCGDKGIACIMEHGTCAEFQEAAKKEYQSSACSRAEQSKAEIPTLPPEVEMDARSDASRAFAKLKAKEEKEKQKKMLVTAKSPEAKAEGKESSTEKDKEKKPTMTQEEKEKAGKKIFAGLVVGVVAIGLGIFLWRRRKSKSTTDGTGEDTSPTASPKSKKPPKPKTDLFQKVKQPLAEAAKAVSSSSSAFAARLKAFTGFGIFKKEDAKSSEEVAKEEAGEAASAEAAPAEAAEAKPAQQAPEEPPKPAAAAAPKEGGEAREEPREY